MYNNLAFTCRLLGILSLWLYEHAPGAAAQELGQTTPDPKADDALGSNPPKILHVHHHDNGFRIKAYTTQDVALEEGKYFASLLFAKYGRNTKSVHKKDLINLFHNLGLNGSEKSEFGFPLSAYEHEHVLIHKHLNVHHNHHLKYNLIPENLKKKDFEERKEVDEPNPSIKKTDRPTFEKDIDRTTGSHTEAPSADLSNHEKRTTFQDLETDTHFSPSDVVTTPVVASKLDSDDAVKSDETSKRNDEKKKTKSRTRTKKGRNKKNRNKKNKKVRRRPERDVSKHPVHHYHNDHTRCATVQEILQAFDMENKDEITLNDFLYMSPAIIYQLDSHCSRITHSAIYEEEIIAEEISDPTQNKTDFIASRSISNIPSKVWGFSFVAVFVISLVGLVGVGVIPLMQKVFYNHLLQFLVALAVGALTGDALLHLLPHALSSGSHHDRSLVWKGLCGLMGIFFFFIMERILHIISDARNRRRLKYGVKKTVREDLQSDEDVEVKTVPENVLSSSTEEKIASDDVFKVTEKDSMLRHQEEGHGHHGHSHGDGKLPDSVAAIAWMVILGDGIHNFSDGLAIGAAFANSITGGFSTSIAIFCHELPHEIGDFAVLLQTGMKVKQAIVYNIVSSVLCLIGMVIGVALGNISDASLWIFACVGGLFIYISLVDMLPEMTSAEKQNGSNRVFQLALQCSGMFTGAGIMLLIAIFEEDLKNILN